ncbi:AAEL011593-PA [Aedes aegypti]|uniref:AAEL011593-PA n=1 Tax=Aedes aegypti TaxID=7159 RepID=Q16PM8_AEDAE|nr:AAEL011593-PA [Aedes aegypti]
MSARSAITLVSMIAVAIALKEGDRCSINGLNGICALRPACPELKQMQQLGVRPKICAYTTTREKIFCCPRVEPIEQATRPSEQYCQQYRKLASTEVHFGALSLDPSAARKAWVPNCDESINLIVGGARASPKEFPHMAALGWIDVGNDSAKYVFKCGGSLISDRYVLSAGHCLLTDHGPPHIVRLGELNLVSDDDGFQGIDYGVAEYILHPDYRPSESRYHDIALLKLNRTVQFGPAIRPACLWTSEDPVERKAIAIGYGQTDFFSPFSNVLMKVSLDLLDYADCSMSYYGGRLLPESIVESQMCALTNGKDTCIGDSGGPLQVTAKDHSCLYYVVGVTSFGMFCGMQVPSVYTRVAAFADWIERIVWPEQP